MQTYDPERHHRRSVRLKGYDYAQPGAYFVTVCVQDRECVLGRIVDGGVELNVYGRVAATMWQRIPRHFPHVELDAWVVMPNHVHGIIVIVDDVRGGGDAFPDGRPVDEGDTGDGGPDGTRIASAECVAPTVAGGDSRRAALASASLGAIVGNYKSVTTRRVNRIRKTPGAPLWQRGFYDHIIRNERELAAVRRYIIQNPLKWALDRDNPENAGVIGEAMAAIGPPDDPHVGR